MGTESREKIGRNEALFREVNEAIERGLWPGEDRSVRFRCECARFDCSDELKLDTQEYERVRQNPRRFVVAPGHQQPEAEDVVETHGSYLVVEKRGAAGEEARARDPRS